MRILLTSSASYAPPRGGSTRGNLVWLKQLVREGHTIQVVSSAWGEEAHSVTDGIEIRTVRDLAVRATVLGEAIRAFDPDIVLVSSEDLSHTLLREAARTAPGRIVYLAHTPQFFPFGPESWNPDRAATEAVRGARAVIAIGHHMAAYIEQHAGCKAKVIHPPIYGSAPFPQFGNFGAGQVLMINPCAVKGISIFLALAARFPALSFTGLAGWGTTSEDRASMARLPNIRLLESVPEIDSVLSEASVLLMPSLWYEGFGLIAMEAMLRGLPVIASDSGGLNEAKAGTGFVIPVKPVTQYQLEFDEVHMPKPVIPEQDLEPWIAAVSTLTTDRDAYAQEAQSSRARAIQFVSALDAAELGRLLTPNRMRILLAHNSLYFPSHGGGDKSNRLLMEALAAKGHQVRVVSRVEHFGEAAHQRLAGQLAQRGVKFEETDELIRFERHGVDIRTLTRSSQLRAYFTRQIDEFDPDVIITSTDDPAQLLFDIARRAKRARVVYLIRATIATPFGPDSSMVSAEKTAVLRQADGVVGVSEYVAGYARQWGGLNGTHVPISLMEAGPAHALGSFTNKFVTLVNPCAVKGIDIFLGLAETMPQIQFAAVPTWGTTPEEFRRMRALPNITLLPPVDDISEVLRQTRVMLVPSVWAEARSRMVMEAMLSAIPVMASDVGGLKEAKLGVPYLLPVNPVTHYRPELDPNMVPIAEVPTQNIAPWQTVLQKLTTDEQHWKEISLQSRTAALEYLEQLTIDPFEAYLEELIRKPKRQPAVSDDRKRLLALRLKQRQATGWFPKCTASDAPKLFCFPHAGAGTLSYFFWSVEPFAVCPALLPGREDRAAETPFERMPDLITALHAAIKPLMNEHSVFFGHSMGAGVAFELVRMLRRAGGPLPRALVVSGAKPPQYRLNQPPQADPTDEELSGQIRSLGGVAEDLIPLAMPVLRADTRLYRNYRYEEDEPLPIPIFAYCADADPNVSPEQMADWKQQTSAKFAERIFPGGHFYLQKDRAAVLAALAEDLNPDSR